MGGVGGGGGGGWRWGWGAEVQLRGGGQVGRWRWGWGVERREGIAAVFRVEGAKQERVKEN